MLGSRQQALVLIRVYSFADRFKINLEERHALTFSALPIESVSQVRDPISVYTQSSAGIFAPLDAILIFDPLRSLAIRHAQDRPALANIHHYHIGCVGCGAKDLADLGDILDRVKDIDRIEAFARKMMKE